MNYICAKLISDMKTNVIFFLCGLMLLTASLYAQPGIQPWQKIKKISVIGSAEMDVEPDEIYVSIVLKEYYNKQKVKIGIQEIKKEFLDNCAKTGIPKEAIRVENLGGSAYQHWHLRKKKNDPNFMATASYVIKFATGAKIDELVPRLNDDATASMYISKISSSKIEEFRKQVKIQATIAAKQKAQYLAESVGEKIAGALSIEEIDGVQPVMYNKMAMSNQAMEMDSGNTGDTPFEKINIRYEIRAEFELQ